MAFQLELNRLKNYDLAPVQVSNHKMHLYFATAKKLSPTVSKTLLKYTHFYSNLLKLAQIGLGNDCQIRVAQLSPGLVETEFTEVMTKDKTKTEELYKSLECLQSEDMADCIKYILEAHPRMQIHDILVRPTQQKF